MEYTDLHIHSEYTIGNGITKISELVKRAKEYGLDYLALTDSGSIDGFNEFGQECKKHNINPIFGCGFYLAPLGHENQVTHHIVLLAKGSVGFNNLLALSRYSFNEGLDNKPRLDFEVLKKYSDSLIVLTGGLGGVFDKPYLSGDRALAMNNIKKLQNIYGENLYLELQDNNLSDNKIMLKVLISLSEELSIPLVVTGGSFYLNREDAELCNKIRVEHNNKILKGDGYYFKSPADINNIFNDQLEAVSNSISIAKEICEMN